MANKTILSIAISCILWGGMSSNVFAALDDEIVAVTDDLVTDVTTPTSGTTTTQPTDTDTDTTTTQPTDTTTQPTGTTQPPQPTQPTGTTQPPQPTQPTGTTQPTQPTQPTGTTQPPQPTQPTGTTQPPQPTQPTGTTQPTQPTQPTGTTQPPQPPQPTQPTGTTQPTQPTQPTGTTQPTQPTGTTQPTQPTQPTGTTQPTQPTQPTGTTQPTQPTQPTGTTQPTQPTQPTGTTQPTQPTQPTGTTQPTQPTQPTGTTQPTQPTQPTGTTQPTQPTGTTQPTQPTQPTGTTTQPTQPTQPTGTTTQPTQPTGTTTQPTDGDGDMGDGDATACGCQPPNNANKPHLKDFGVDDSEVDQLDSDKVEKLPPQAFNAFDKQTIKNLPSTAVTKVTSEQVAQLSEDAVTALKPEQVQNMPAQAMVGLTAKQIGSLPAVVLQKLPAEHFKNLNKTEVKNLDSKGLSKVLVNLNTQEVKTEEVKDVLPDGWTVDSKGKITAPAGSTLSLPTKTVAQTSNTVNVEEPVEVTNLDSTLTVGGTTTSGETTVLDNLNSCLKTAGFANFKMKQDSKTGKIVVEGSGDAQGAQLTFTTKSDSVKQADANATTGLSQDETGHYVLTTEDKKQVTVIPAAKDTKQLAQSLGDASAVKVAENGVTTVEIRKDAQSSTQVQAMVFDPMITQASSGKKAGIYMEGATGEIVYSDGTSQKILPTVPQADQFVTTATKFPGVEKAQLNADGTVAVQYKGMKLKLCAKQFTTQTTPLATGQTVEPTISVQADGTVKYTTQEGTNQVESTLTITE